MDDTSSRGLPSSWSSLESAYKALNIRDPTTSDGNVVVGFHQRYSTLAPSARTILIGALELISSRRQSRLLSFVLTIIPHLTKDNVALLATPPTPSAASLHNDRQQASGTANSSRAVVPAQQSSAQAITVNPVVPTSENEPATTAADSTDDLSATSVDDMSVPSEENYSTCFYSSSSEVNNDSTDYESEESLDGRFWNGQTWRCDQCYNEIIEGECPLGHNLNPCKVCEEDPEDCTCDKSQSTSDDEDLAGIVWDDHDGIWRCTACLWEVEANSEDNGECHCVSKPNDKSAGSIELLYYHDYEPADSDSSWPGSESDYETDSGDESFIDDDGPFDSSLFDMISHPSQARDDLKRERRSATVQPEEGLIQSIQPEEGPIQSMEPESMDTT